VSTPFLVGVSVSLTPNFLFDMGFNQLKMRHHCPAARISPAIADLHFWRWSER